MDTSSSSSSIVCQSGQTAAQRRFYQWVLKWINGVHSNSCNELQDEHNDVRGPSKPDVPIIACFFQALGFKLLSFEKHTEEKREYKRNLKIAIECGSSCMKAVLELPDVECHCPNPDHVKDASFWSISGTGPIGSVDNLAQRVEETGSNLLPHVSKDVAKVLRDVSQRLFEIITVEPDINRNNEMDLNASRMLNVSYERRTTGGFAHEMPKPETGSGLIRSHTQPEMRFRSNSFNSKSYSENQSGARTSSPRSYNKPPLSRQKTWDIDIGMASLDGEPRPSPPRITSSPAMAPELSNSLGQLSLQSEIQNPNSLRDYIVGAQKNLEKALNMLLTKKPPGSNDTTPNKDADLESVKSAPARMSPFKMLSAQIRNAKPMPKFNSMSRESSFTKINGGDNDKQDPKARRSIEPTMTKSLNRRTMQLDSGQSKIAVQRRSFGIPLPTSTSKLQKFPGVDCNLSAEPANRSLVTMKSRASPETPQTGASPMTKSMCTPNPRTPSMLKPPTKISVPKAIAGKLKTPQSAPRLSMGNHKRNSFSRD